MPRAGLGFDGSAWLRLGAAALFMTAVVAGVLVVTGGGVAAAPAALVPAALAPAAGRLVLETTYPVARWTVQVHGRDVAATASAAQRWEGELAAGAGSVFVQAEAADPASAAPVALRWSLPGRGGILWGEGGVAETLAPAAGDARADGAR